MTHENKKLFLTTWELDEILTECYESRFKKITDNVPEKYRFGSYVNNNRTYSNLYFMDKETKETYYIEYSSHNDYGLELSDGNYTYTDNFLNEKPLSIVELDSKIQLVKNSVIIEEDETVQVGEVEEKIEETEIQKIKNIYFSLTLTDFEEGLKNVSLEESKKVKLYISKKTPFNLDDFFMELLKISIKHKIDVNKLKNFFYSKKKHLGNREEQIKAKKKQIIKL